MTEELTKIRKDLKKKLKKERFEHTVGVMYTAASLAMRFGADIQKALTAGLLHDCGKYCSVNDQIKLCGKYGIELTKSELEMPALIHAKLGAYLAEHEYGIKDPEILNAVAYHTTGRPGMSFPMIMQRNTGLQFINLGVSGNSKLQLSFAAILGDNACDAIVVDAFSNPGPEMIRERFLPFVAAVREAHPETPLIFLQTIYRERCNFDRKERQREAEKRRAAREVFEQAAKIYDNLYLIDEPDLTGTDHLTSLDGTHPDDLGYWRWAQAIQPRLVKILKRHGIR